MGAGERLKLLLNAREVDTLRAEQDGRLHLLLWKESTHQVGQVGFVKFVFYSIAKKTKSISLETVHFPDPRCRPSPSCSAAAGRPRRAARGSSRRAAGPPGL